MQPLYLVSSFPLTFEAMNPPKPSLVVFEKAIFALSKFQKNLENRPKNTKNLTFVKPRFLQVLSWEIDWFSMVKPDFYGILLFLVQFDHFRNPLISRNPASKSAPPGPRTSQNDLWTSKCTLFWNLSILLLVPSLTKFDPQYVQAVAITGPDGVLVGI